MSTRRQAMAYLCRTMVLTTRVCVLALVIAGAAGTATSVAGGLSGQISATAMPFSSPGDQPARCGPDETVYVVVVGDTLRGIAVRHGVTVSALRLANPQVQREGVIFPDSQLCLPARQARPSEPAETDPTAAGRQNPAGGSVAPPSGQSAGGRGALIALLLLLVLCTAKGVEVAVRRWSLAAKPRLWSRKQTKQPEAPSTGPIDEPATHHTADRHSDRGQSERLADHHKADEAANPVPLPAAAPRKPPQRPGGKPENGRDPRHPRIGQVVADRTAPARAPAAPQEVAVPLATEPQVAPGGDGEVSEPASEALATAGTLVFPAPLAAVPPATRQPAVELIAPLPEGLRIPQSATVYTTMAPGGLICLDGWLVVWAVAAPEDTPLLPGRSVIPGLGNHDSPHPQMRLR